MWLLIMLICGHTNGCSLKTAVYPSQVQCEAAVDEYNRQSWYPVDHDHYSCQLLESK